jgi:hypothetical protein
MEWSGLTESGFFIEATTTLGAGANFWSDDFQV